MSSGSSDPTSYLQSSINPAEQNPFQQIGLILWDTQMLAIQQQSREYFQNEKNGNGHFKSGVIGFPNVNILHWCRNRWLTWTWWWCLRCHTYPCPFTPYCTSHWWLNRCKKLVTEEECFWPLTTAPFLVPNNASTTELWLDATEASTSSLEHLRASRWFTPPSYNERYKLQQPSGITALQIRISWFFIFSTCWRALDACFGKNWATPPAFPSRFSTLPSDWTNIRTIKNTLEGQQRKRSLFFCGVGTGPGTTMSSCQCWYSFMWIGRCRGSITATHD